MPSQAIYRGLKQAGIDFVASVPCVNFQPLFNLLQQDASIQHVPVTREEEGVGLCAGAWLGGKRPALLMQNSGLGNCVNAFASLNLFYGVPLLLIVSHRGSAGEPMLAQVPMGEKTPKLLEVLELPCFAPRPAEAEATVVRAWESALARQRPAGVLFDLKFWKGQ